MIQHIVNLTINNSNTGSSFETACDSYTWEGVVYTWSGTYTNTYINLSGCDSVHTLNLTINQSDNTFSSVHNLYRHVTRFLYLGWKYIYIQ